jgi:hypothetical protein
MAKAGTFARSIDILGVIAELRLAKATADFFTGITAVEQQAWVDDLVQRTEPALDGAPYLCLFDTGPNRGHRLVRPAGAEADLHSYKPQWCVDDRYGHGMPMAGLPSMAIWRLPSVGRAEEQDRQAPRGGHCRLHRAAADTSIFRGTAPGRAGWNT